MKRIDIKYRTQRFSVNIDPSKSVQKLKKKVSYLTGISHNNFDLQVNKIIATTSKFISNYLNDEAIFTMVNVSIDVIVVLNDQNKSFCVKELMKINDFVEEIIRSYRHETELSLLYNDIKLVDGETILANGVVQNATLTTKSGKPNFIKRVTVTYRDKSYQIDIDERKSVAEFKKVVSELTYVMVKHFCLKLNEICLLDHTEMSMYIKYGTNFVMANVTIAVYTLVIDKKIRFYVNEDSTINDFKKEIITQQGITGDINLYYNTGNLLGSSTLLECSLEQFSSLIVIMDNVIVSGTKELTIKYRDLSYKVTIDTSKTINELKNEVSKLLDIKANKFFFDICWIKVRDEDKISDYMKYGTWLRLCDVTINVILKLDGKNFHFSVKEEITVDEFIMEIIRRSGRNNISYLMYDDNTLDRTKTLKRSGVEHNSAVIAATTITGG